MSELKKCPFCEFQVSYPATSSDDNGYTTCPNCGGKAPHSVWQSRPIEDALQARIDELEEKVKTQARWMETFWKGIIDPSNTPMPSLPKDEVKHE